MATSISRRQRRTSTPSEGTSTMGVSRDYTERPSRSTSATAVLERTARTRDSEAPVQPPPPQSPARPRRAEGYESSSKSRQRLGSRQVVSVRGRRTQPIKNVGLLPKVSFIAIALLIGGVVLAVALSGVATQQTFRINSLVAQESQLSNEVETLNRDLENVSSSAELARRAQEMNMVIPRQPGILTVEESGRIAESRPATGEVSPIIDVNGEPIRPGQASSDPNQTEELNDNLEAVPQGEQLRPEANAGAGGGEQQPAPAAQQPQVANVAPYSGGAPAPAPAPAPAAEQAPAPEAAPDPAAEGAPEAPTPAPAAPEAPEAAAPAPEVPAND